jgi:hypothetical protein
VQVGNRQQLDAKRHALRDAFDAAWMSETKKTSRGQRAAHCAVLLSNPDLANHRFANSIIGRGWRRTAPDVLICAAKPGDAEDQGESILSLFSNDIAATLRRAA